MKRNKNTKTKKTSPKTKRIVREITIVDIPEGTMVLKRVDNKKK